jgi:dTDP-4-amino-4,6-dideoxygalactose transaminase
LEGWNEKRRSLAKEYARLLEGTEGVILPHEPSWSKAVYHLYVVRVAEREKLQADLAGSGIGTAIHYPIPLHQQKAYQRLGYRTGDFPVAERVALEIVSLPMFPQLTLSQQAHVVDEVRRLVAEEAAPELVRNESTLVGRR